MNASNEWLFKPPSVDGNAAQKSPTPSDIVVEEGTAVSFDMFGWHLVLAVVRSQRTQSKSVVSRGD